MPSASLDPVIVCEHSSGTVVVGAVVVPGVVVPGVVETAK